MDDLDMSTRPALAASTARKTTSTNESNQMYTVGQIKELQMINFMCHQHFSIRFHPSPMQIVTGANGSGKSTIANAVGLCLGAQARTTGRTTNVQSFIRKGETSAQLTLILANEGPEAFKPDQYGKEIRISRKIGPRQSVYQVMGASGKVISRRREMIDEITQALSISPENPLCILHQEIAKTFLLNSDSKKKYQFYMRVSQLEQIKQAFEDGIYTIALLTQRVDAMKQKHEEMRRALVPLEEEVKKLHVRREQGVRKQALETELMSARADQARQKFLDAQDELEQRKTQKDGLEKEIRKLTNRLVRSKQQLGAYFSEINDLEMDLYGQHGLQDLNVSFSKEKKERQSALDETTLQCESYQLTITELEQEQINLQKQLDMYGNVSKQWTENEQRRVHVQSERSTRERKLEESGDRIDSLTIELTNTNGHVHDKQRSLDFLNRERQEKQREFNELTQLERDRSHAYGSWMSNCLKAIQDEKRFHKPPIGPIGRFIHCSDPRWSLAVEKHLSSILPSFICADNHDEQILVAILSSYSESTRPPIFIQAYADRVHDVSGTLKCIQRAGLLSIYQVLRIDDMTVANVLIDHRQVEATILLNDLEEAKRIRQSGVLRWSKIDHQVRQVREGWTSDGSNVRFDQASRIYPTDPQPMRYFLSANTSTASIAELEGTVKQLDEQIQQTSKELDALRQSYQQIREEMHNAQRVNAENKTQLKELVQELDCLNALMPVPFEGALEEVYEKVLHSIVVLAETVAKHHRANEEKELGLGLLADATENLDWVMKRSDRMTQEHYCMIEKSHKEQSKQHQIQQQLSKLTTKLNQIDQQIQQTRATLTELIKKQSKKSKEAKTPVRSVREIQLELDAINNYLKANEDTNEQRRQLINEFQLKRNQARVYWESYERCRKQIKRLNEFILKRKERFVAIADQHEFLVSYRFQYLMHRQEFTQAGLVIDHKREELEITIEDHSKSLASLSGGERSTSTLCFLLALWECVYQPFRLMDEIDIYMDHQRRNSSLEILYENTKQNSSSQHIVFTPQHVDAPSWDNLHVPVFYMPTPKRSRSSRE